MPIPDSLQLNRSQHLGDSIRVAVTTTELTTPVQLPAGFYQIVADVDCRWKQAGSWCRFAATPSAPSVGNEGTAGSTTYAYKVVAVMPDASASTAPVSTGRSAVSAAGTTTTGNATLSVTDFNRLTITAVTGAASYDVYRTTGGATQGKIGNSTALTFDDTGLVGDASTAPTVSTAQGHLLPASTMFGDVFVDAGGNDDAYFNIKTVSGTGTIEFLPVTP